VPSILADIWAGSLLPEILMILFTQSRAVLHKYLNDELKILFLTIFPWCCTEFPEFSTFREIPGYSRFSRLLMLNRIQAGRRAHLRWPTTQKSNSESLGWYHKNAPSQKTSCGARHNKLRRCCHLANDTDLLTPVLWAMAGDNKQLDLWPADPFTRIDPKFNQVFVRHSTSSPKISCKSVQPFSRNVADKETKKEIARKQYPVPLRGSG